jgi:hypothetical protein
LAGKLDGRLALDGSALCRANSSSVRPYPRREQEINFLLFSIQCSVRFEPRIHGRSEPPAPLANRVSCRGLRSPHLPTRLTGNRPAVKGGNVARSGRLWTTTPVRVTGGQARKAEPSARNELGTDKAAGACGVRTGADGVDSGTTPPAPSGPGVTLLRLLAPYPTSHPAPAHLTHPSIPGRCVPTCRRRAFAFTPVPFPVVLEPCRTVVRRHAPQPPVATATAGDFVRRCGCLVQLRD